METAAQRQKTAVFPGCATPNYEDVHFCEQCGAPLTSYAATAPFESTLARGYAYRNAVTAKPSPVVLIGVWLTMLPLAIVSGLALLGSLSFLVLAIAHLHLAGIIGAVFASGGSFVLFWISAGILVRVTRNYLFAVPDSAIGSASTPAGRESPHGTTECESTTCLSCGESMSADDDACAACGWSYDDNSTE